MLPEASPAAACITFNRRLSRNSADDFKKCLFAALHNIVRIPALYAWPAHEAKYRQRNARIRDGSVRVSRSMVAPRRNRGPAPANEVRCYRAL